MSHERKRIVRGASALFLGAALAAATPLLAKDVYKAFLDPGQPHHRAILDTLERLKATPNDGALHNDLGCLVAWDGFWRDALREFETAASLDKKDSKPLFNAGLVHAWRGSWSSARRSFAAATRREGGNWPAWWMLGFAEERLGNVDAAVDAYKTSLRVDTSLFDVARNPFAAGTKLKPRVLLETYERRLVRATMPVREEFSGADRIAAFFQKAEPSPAVEKDEGPAVATGPVVTAAPAGSDAGRSGPRPAPRVIRAPEQEPPTAEPPDNLPFQQVTPAPQKKRPAMGPGGSSDE